MKVVFFGTPLFAVNPLVKLHESSHEVLAVVTQPDRAKNRKGEYIDGAVKAKAKELGLNILQFESVKREGVETLKNLKADIFVSAGYGQLFSQEIIDIAPHGIINVHASLLPAYRGSSPIQWAIINGETVTGVTIMQTDIGLDTGDILLMKECAIDSNDTTFSLTEKLSRLGGELLINALDKIEAGAIKPIKQDHLKATKFPLITKETGKLDFNKTAGKLRNMIRAIDCHTYIDGKYVKILEASVGTIADSANNACNMNIRNNTDSADNASNMSNANNAKDSKSVCEIDGEIDGRVACESDSGAGSEVSGATESGSCDKAGQICSVSNGIAVCCGGGRLIIERLQPENKKPMSAKEFLSGYAIKTGTVIG